MVRKQTKAQIREDRNAQLFVGIVSLALGFLLIGMLGGVLGYVLGAFIIAMSIKTFGSVSEANAKLK